MPNQKQLQRAFRDHVVAQNPQMMITFNYVRQVTYDQMQAQIIDFANKMQRCVLGREWMKRDLIDRPCLIGVAEHLDANLHVHAALIAPPTFIEFAGSLAAEALWRSIHNRCGPLHAGQTRNVEAMAAYIAKTLYQDNSFDRGIYYTPRRTNPETQ
jgi:hypothetical protein